MPPVASEMRDYDVIQLLLLGNRLMARFEDDGLRCVFFVHHQNQSNYVEQLIDRLHHDNQRCALGSRLGLVTSVHRMMSTYPEMTQRQVRSCCSDGHIYTLHVHIRSLTILASSCPEAAF